MVKSQKNAFVVIPNDTEQFKWLEEVLSEEGDAINTNSETAEQVSQVIASTGTQLLFVGLSVENLRKRAAFIEDLLIMKPMLLVVAVADQADNQMLITAMRSGAREFITKDTEPKEIIRLLKRLQYRSPLSGQSYAHRGQVISMLSARPDSGSPMLALHVALDIQQQAQAGNKVILLDLGAPVSDSLLYLGISAPYTFVDAVRSVRRLDATLIDSAFAKHKSGLKLLSLPEENSLGQLTSADIYALMGVLQQHFSHVVINLGGVPYSNFLQLLVSYSDTTLAVIEQSVPSCKQNMQLIRKLSQAQFEVNKIQLVVDRYLPSLPPNANDLARGMNLTLLTTLSSSGMARLKMMNSGESLFECAPRDPYTVGVHKITKSLLKLPQTENKASSNSWVSRFFSGSRKTVKATA